MKKKLILLTAVVLSFTATHAQDAAATGKIKEQGLKQSNVMNYAFQLTDVSGPRLTNSPGYFRAANWAKAELAKLGLTNAALEPWGDFGKGWELKKSYIAMTAPYYRPLIGFPKTWTRGTNGLKSAEIIVVKAADSAALEAYKGKLKNKIVLLYRNDTLKPTYKADAGRHSDAELSKMAAAETDTSRRRGNPARTLMGSLPMATRVRRLAEKEEAIAVLTMSPSGFHGTLFVQGGGAYGATDPENFPDMMIAFEDYMSLVRLAEAGVPVKLDIETQTEFFTKDIKGYNVIAEIKGTDPKLKEEVVMLGGHLDSWQGSTGATDNAAGCAVMMEAVRIIQQSGLRPRRTIRIALWGGEEQGLHGSRNYVKNHFADPATMQLKPEHGKISAYYNIDNGTGKVRGIYLQSNDAVRNIFTQWLKPFNDLGAGTVTISNTGGTDHQAFDAVGIPGFQFIQDEIEYDTRTHHTNMDSYDHLQAEDLKQVATIVASFVYNSANLEEKLPRKALPAARGN
ncbi:MAG: M20/M25/M40 family metallo-hydrolase [Rhizobacter sp.]|nr:M20/M25/M40 family metallo-hydrolase [Ferruginibacter sp.]